MTNDSTPEERQLIDSLCEKTRRMAVQTAARFVNVTKIPRIIAEKISLPDPGPIEFHAKEIDNSTKRLANIAVSPAIGGAVIAAENFI